MKKNEREIEVKIKLGSVSQVKKKFDGLGVSWSKPKTLVDKYYRPKGKEKGDAAAWLFCC